MALFIEYFANLIDAFLGTWFVMKFNKSSIHKCKWFFPTIVSTFAVANVFTHWQDFSMLHPVVFLLLLLGFSFSVKSDSLLRKIISPFIFMLTIIIVNSVIIFALSNLLHLPISDLVSKSFLGRYLHLLLCKIVLSAVILILCRLFTIKDHFSVYDLVLYLLFPIITVVTLYIFIKLGIDYDITKYTYLIIPVLFALALINFSTLVLFKKTVENTSAQHELDLINSRKELEEERYKELGDLYNQLQITRHDIKNHLVSINCLLEQHQYEEVNKYISNKQAELVHTQHFCHTNNRMIDYIIDSNMSQHRDIFFIISGKLAHMEVINEMDLSSLLGNMLSNAVKGTDGSDPKQIEIEFSIHGIYQNIICKNTIQNSILKTNPELVSTRKDKSRHGYGIKSMRNIVEKYDGIIQFYEEGRKFCVHASLPMVDLSTL